MRYVYKLQNLINGKVYIGQTKHPSGRKASHFYVAKKNDKRPLYASIRKHGAENFSFEVLEECVDELIDEREQHWVTHFDSYNPEKGYNLTTGGRRGDERVTLGRKLSEEHKRKISEGNRGRPSAMLGKHHTTETKARTSAALKGRPKGPMSKEHRENLSAALKGKTAWNKGLPPERHPRFGKRASEETIRKMKKPRSEEAKQRMRDAQRSRASTLHPDVVHMLQSGMTIDEAMVASGKSRGIVTRVQERLLA